MMFSLSFVGGSKSAEGGPYPQADLDRGGLVFLEILADPKLFLTSGLNKLGGSINRSTIKIDLYFCIKLRVGCCLNPNKTF